MLLKGRGVARPEQEGVTLGINGIVRRGKRTERKRKGINRPGSCVVETIS